MFYIFKSARKQLTFEIDQSDFIGRGRSGNVYRVYLNGQVMAVKYCTDQELFGEMANEANILRHLNRKNCVNVPTLLYEQRTENEYFIVISYIDGEHASFKERGPEIEKALQEVHNCQVLHGDIKEDNFLVTSDGSIFVIDFGFAKISSDKLELKAEINQLRSEISLRPLRLYSPLFKSDPFSQDKKGISHSHDENQTRKTRKNKLNYTKRKSIIISSVFQNILS